MASAGHAIQHHKENYEMPINTTNNIMNRIQEEPKGTH
jgi:hypothetical protein